jgi:hypothetical protein
MNLKNVRGNYKRDEVVKRSKHATKVSSGTVGPNFSTAITNKQIFQRAQAFLKSVIYYTIDILG